jgi:hypothetical protein
MAPDERGVDEFRALSDVKRRRSTDGELDLLSDRLGIYAGPAERR